MIWIAQPSSVWCLYGWCYAENPRSFILAPSLRSADLFLAFSSSALHERTASIDDAERSAGISGAFREADFASRVAGILGGFRETAQADAPAADIGGAFREVEL